MEGQDLFRDTPVRYLGYANEVGEAFRAFIGSRWVLATYGIATSYVLADTIDKSTKIYTENQNQPNQLIKTAYVATDVLIWQMLASVLIPGITINKTCALTSKLLEKQRVQLPKNVRKALVTCIGLGLIPFIIKPIDHMTDMLLDNTIRKFTP